MIADRTIETVAGWCLGAAFGAAVTSIAFYSLPARGQDAAERLGAATPSSSIITQGPVLSAWTHRGEGIAYLFGGNVTLDVPDADPFTRFATGAQINAYAKQDQYVFGIATEAWALPGSRAAVVGLEATAINMEPSNLQHKIALWATFKTRPDWAWSQVPREPGNTDSQALRIESQPGTGFARGIVFAPISLHASSAGRPVAIDFSETSLESVDLMRFSDGCTLVYRGRGWIEAVCP